MTRALIIAEAGVNHNGCLETALKLVDTAAEAGADYIKFQTFKAEALVSRTAALASYQKIHSDKGSQFELLKSLELSPEMHTAIRSHCQKRGIKFLSTPFSEADADYLEEYVEFFKVPSGEITNLPFLAHLARKQKNLIISTGMATMDEVKEAKSTVFEVWNNKGFPKAEEQLPGPLTFLHCTSAYPAPFSDVNLLAIQTLARETACPVGYSDHTRGIEVSIAAVVLGAVVIEKHFTLSRSLPGPDHKSSLEPEELTALISSIRNVEIALGSEEKHPSEEEAENAGVVRKSLHYKHSLKAGTSIDSEMLIIKRPGTGLSPKNLKLLLGKVLKRDVSQDQIVNQFDFE